MKIFLKTFFILMLATPLFSVDEIKNEATIPILTPSLSKQKQLKLRLDNGLEALIISDPETDKSGAVLSVEVGSWEDPIDQPGIAHFLEHMLFMGTKKYPNEGEYHRYIQDNSGQANAFTANYLTSYMFSINNNAFDEALDRFSQFFKEPLFNPSGVSRELRAIDQEYEMNVQKNDIREYFVYKAIADPSHPFSRFNIGNSETLKKVTQKDLIDWYHQHYSANIMRLLVVSPEPLEKLKQLVIKDFSGIKNNGKKPLTLTQRYTQKAMQGSMVIIEPLKDTRSLSIIWELPLEFVKMDEVKPATIVSNVLGHEGEESLLAELIREGLAVTLSCGPSNSGAINRDFLISITLTDKGLHEVNKVIERVFQAINNFKNQGLPQDLFDEIQKTELLKYQYQPRENVFNHLMKHGITLFDEALSTYPEQTQITQKYSSKDVAAFLQYLTPQNAIFFLTAPKGTTNYKADREEPWLHVNYSIHKIDADLLKSWNNAPPNPHIKLPMSNPFLPDSLVPIANQEENPASTSLIPQPDILIENEKTKIYYCLDEKFQEPKVNWFIEIKSPEVNNTNPIKSIMGDLYVKLLSKNLKKYSYPAELAGLNYEIKQEHNGIIVEIAGFSDKARYLLKIILESMNHLEINSDDFSTYKQLLIRKYQNFSKESPMALATELLKSTINLNYATNKEKASAARQVTLKKFQNYVNELFKKTYLQGLFYGNTSKEEAIEIADLLASTFPGETYDKTEQLEKEIIDLPSHEGPFYLERETAMQGNALILAIEYMPYTLKARSVQEILMQGMQEPFFSELRTKQQTGYIVFSTGQDIERHLFNLFGTQSVTHNPRDLLARFELFIENFLQEMEESYLTKERFEQIQAASIKNLEIPANGLEGMGNLLKTLAFNFNGDFSWIDQRLQNLKALTYDEFLIIARDMLGKLNRKRIGCAIKGTQLEDKVLNYKPLPNINALKKASTFSSGIDITQSSSKEEN